MMPTSATVMPTASSSGCRLGPGRWISSPAGGTVRVERAHDDVDQRGDERHAEHEEADDGGDEAGADVLAGELLVHVRLVRDPRASRRRPSRRTAARGRRARRGTGAGRLRRSARRYSSDGAADEEPAEHERGRRCRSRPKPAGAERQLRDRVQQDGVEQDLPARLVLAAHDGQHRHADARVLVLHQQRRAPRSAAASRRRRSRRGRPPCRRGRRSRPPSRRAAGPRPAAPPMTMFCGVRRLSQIV